MITTPNDYVDNKKSDPQLLFPPFTPNNMKMSNSGPGESGKQPHNA